MMMNAKYAVLIIAIALIGYPLNAVFGAEIIFYNQVNENTIVPLSSNNDIANGMVINLDTSTLYGKTVNSLSVKLHKNGSPTGLVYAGVWSNSTDPPSVANAKYIFNSTLSQDLPAIATLFTFTNLTGAYTITTNDVIGIFYDGGSYPTNFVYLTYFDNDETEATAQYRTVYDTTSLNEWLPDFDLQLTGKVSYTDGSSELQTQFCIDTTGDGQANLCFEDTNGDGIPDFSSTAEVVTNANPPTAIVGKLLCQTGLIENCTNGVPTNTDVTDNGVGLVLFFFTLALILAIFGVALYGRVKVEYHLMLYVVGMMIAVGLAVAFSWLDVMWFYIMMFIIIGFATIGSATFILSKRRGSGGSE